MSISVPDDVSIVAHDDKARFESRGGGMEPRLDAIDVSRLELPALRDGVDLGSLYELAEELAAQGVR